MEHLHPLHSKDMYKSWRESNTPLIAYLSLVPNIQILGKELPVFSGPGHMIFFWPSRVPDVHMVNILIYV